MAVEVEMEEVVKANIKRTVKLAEMVKRVQNEPKPKMVFSVIKEGSFGIIYGLAKTGKTIFCENLGLSIAGGKNEFMGRPIEINNRKVLFISLEEFYPFRTERNIGQLKGLNDIQRQKAIENFIVATENMPKQFSSNADWNILAEEIEKHQPGVVIIDSLTRLVDGQVETSEIAKKAMLNLRKIAEEFKVTLIVIHHSTKIDYQQPMTLTNLAGSRVVSQECDFIFGFNRTHDNKRYLKLIAARYGNDNIEKVALFSLDENLWCKYERSVPENELLVPKTDGRIVTSNTDIIYNFMIENYSTSEVTANILKNNIVKEGIMSEPTMHSALNKLIENGKIVKTGHGMYKLT